MPADGVIGRSIDILFPEERKTAMMTNIRQALRGEQWESVEIPIQHTSGDIRTVLWNSATLFRPDGKTALSVIAQGQDITLRKIAEEELERKNDDLNAINEELTAAQEELRRKLDELSARERQLRESESELREILAEKDILLAEIHHRVKNNLTALISLLSLEGGQGDTPEAQAFRNDIQNRARSMALIHETLYRTKKYSEVDMGVYLKNLLDQMQASLSTTVPYRINIVSDNVMLDIPRATPCGLIVNEMVTNVFKHAYPASFDCMKERGAPPTIIIALSLSDGEYTLRFSDNGVGLPAGIDITKSQSLGLKLINFLARHQLRATVNIDTSTGTAFSFRFREKIR
jgi:two-component sensor histidine kinase